MPVTQLVFTGVPAFVGQVLGPTKVRFFIDEKTFDPNQLIEVDLAKHPKAVQAASWGASVDCDHQTAGGRTTLGPTFHHDGNHRGCVYLAERVVNQYATVLASWPPTPDAIYQYQLVLRAGDPGQRYHGFKVRVVSAAVGSHAHVDFFRIGEQAPMGMPHWIDLADAADCDPASNGFTAITPASPVGTEGALFMSSRVIAADWPTHPKLPPWLGW